MYHKDTMLFQEAVNLATDLPGRLYSLPMLGGWRLIMYLLNDFSLELLLLSRGCRKGDVDSVTLEPANVISYSRRAIFSFFAKRRGVLSLSLFAINLRSPDL